MPKANTALAEIKTGKSGITPTIIFEVIGGNAYVMTAPLPEKLVFESLWWTEDIIKTFALEY